VVEQRQRFAVLPAVPQHPAVQVHEHGRATETGTVAVDVQAVAPSRVAVPDARDPLDVAAPHEERREEDPGNREPARGHGNAQTLDKGAVKHRPGSQGAHDNQDQPGGGEDA
jgi:hypothetical protein